MNSVVIIGAGGSGREISQIFVDINKVSNTWNVVGYLDENQDLYGQILNGFPVLGSFDWLNKNMDNSLFCIISVNSPIARKNIVKKLESIPIQYCNAIHPTVILWDSVEMGKDIVLQARSLLSVNTKIGNHVQLNTNSTVGHDAIISDYCTIGPRVDINGNDYIGEGVYIGSGATLIQEVSIGSWTTIGAGAVVTNHIGEQVVAVGVPARPIKNSSTEQIY